MGGVGSGRKKGSKSPAWAVKSRRQWDRKGRSESEKRLKRIYGKDYKYI